MRISVSLLAVLLLAAGPASAQKEHSPASGAQPPAKRSCAPGGEKPAPAEPAKPRPKPAKPVKKALDKKADPAALGSLERQKMLAQKAGLKGPPKASVKKGSAPS